ncbi:hypothetical protein BDV25DRAFT_128318 [Aspergillus avenaceus]|uniref:THIF-type NAD/FAD binding fold domain-containing protein n=1 Tax=Aspergillus avenaceus TaxID=36643 RepID=A0A5N6U086_ASPAV|nr:hypothetical protein BDV25DRAFT_128318 [Aspergillus avenaceus]
MSWLQRNAGSQQSQLATTAVISGAAVAGAIFSYQAFKRREAVKQLKASIPKIGDDQPAGKLTRFGVADPAQQLSKEDERSAALARRAQLGDYDDELILEQLARNRVFLTDEGLEKLRSSFVIVVGCGGVGSHAVASLVRSGVSKVRLIDFDQVTLSSLNRHALATLADVGTPKVHCIRKRLEQITPWAKFDCRNELFGGSVADALLAPWSMGDDDKGRKPDYVLDCIDNITSKVELLHYCHSHSIPVISSMGAGCKSDPTCVTVGDISTSTDDPLSRSTRRRLKILGVGTGVPVVFSTEKPGPGKASLLPLAEEEFNKGQVGELSVLPDFRARILPVLGTMPAVFGYTVANHVICDIAGYPTDYSIARKGKDKIYDSVQTAFQGFMERLTRTEVGHQVIGLRLPITKDDVVFLVDEIWKGKSAISGLPGRLILVPWERPAQGFVPEPKWEQHGQKYIPLELKDLVCMTKEESAEHEKNVLLGDKKPEDVYDEEIVQKIKEHSFEFSDDSSDDGLFLNDNYNSSSSHRFTKYTRPLIDSVRNGWQFSPKYTSLPTTNVDTSDCPRWFQMLGSIVAAPRFRRYVVVYLSVLISCWVGWKFFLSPRLEEQAAILRALDPQLKDGTRGWFGANAVPTMDNMVQLRTLEPSLLPAGPGEYSGKRLIFIGDVHGCKIELDKLLEEVDFNPENDHLIFAGDMINKGPDSLGVVDLAREYSASCVRGNHEDRVLNLRHNMISANTLVDSSLDDENLHRGQYTKERKLAREMSDEQADWLDTCPVVLNVGQVKGIGQVAVAHAGLSPSVDLDRQDPYSVMNMLTVDLKTHVPSASRKGTKWTKLFNKHQELLYSSLHNTVEDPESMLTTVIYGHDPKSGLSLKTYTKGLDTGCIKGGKLTALVVEDGGKQKTVQVKCNKHNKR